jgi:hypothetical protein
MAGKSRREYSAGEPIFSQGDLANSVFYIQSGKCAVMENWKRILLKALGLGIGIGIPR